MKNKKIIIRRSIQICSVLLLVGCSAFLIYYLGIQPYLSKKVNNKYRELYYTSDDKYPSDTERHGDSSSEPLAKDGEEVTEDYLKLDTSEKKGAKDENGILLKFSKLLSYNIDIKGWLCIPGTGMDYPVMQAYNGSDFYLSHDFEGNSDKNGCLYIDWRSDVKAPSKNIVIHGHNMKTTGMMFHELPNYEALDYYKQHPVITFDSIYQEAQWKVIAFLRVSGTNAENGGFNYMQSDFENDEDFLDFLYQIEMRSLYHCPVNVNENDSILMLSTCSYELDNYRTVIVARKVRKKESPEVDTSSVYLQKNVLYPDKWYSEYGGTPPLTTSFTEAMSFHEIDWYDGDIKVEDAIGKIVEYQDSNYKITSKTTVTYMGCKNKQLESLTVPSKVTIERREYDVTELSQSAFADMNNLINLRIGDGITEIKPKTFMDCKRLENVVLGESITTIGKLSFKNLEHLKSIIIKSLKLESIDVKAFHDIAPKARFKLPESRFKKYRKLIEESKVSEKSKYVIYDFTS